MPAVQLETLETHIGNLAWKFTRPVEFQQSLANLLTFYSDQGYRAGVNVPKNFGNKIYRVPQIVLTNIEHKLTDWCIENPDSAQLLADQLRQDDYFEPRVLAAHILGQLPFEKFAAVVEMVKNWAEEEKDRLMLDKIFSEASYRLRSEDPDRWITLSKEWLASQVHWDKILGIRALIPLVKDRNFVNLPYIYQLITPLLSHPHLVLQNDLLILMEVLIKRIPNEVSYLLQDILLEYKEAPVQRLVRKLLPMFSASVQGRLRQTLSG